jgi:hypothetical protein
MTRMCNCQSWQDSHGVTRAFVCSFCREPGAVVPVDDPRKVQLDLDDPKGLTDPRMPGIGGAPTRATTLPTDGKERKKFPVASGLLDYFPDALVAVAEVSWRGNQQHNPGQPMHWARSKSTDEADTMIRHFLQRGLRDTDGLRHTAKMAWRALALLQKEIEAGL